MSVHQNLHFDQSYYRGELLANLRCSTAGSRLDISEPKSIAPRAYHLELLLQPVDETGWPRGQARCLYEADVSMAADRWSTWSRGVHRLPFRFEEDLLRRCHLRLTPTKITLSHREN